MTFAMFTTLSALLAGLLLAAGVTLVLSGLIGRRVGKEPRCPRCRHDLTGLDGKAACPECGRPMAGGVLHGLRRPGRRRVVVGSACLLVGALSAAALINAAGVLRRLPNAWLTGVDYPNAGRARRMVVLAELLRRLQSKELSPSETASFVTTLLDEQAEAAAANERATIAPPWDPQAGEFVVAAAQAGAVHAADVDRFVLNAFDVALRFAPTLEAGELRPQFVLTANRLHRASGAMAAFDAGVDARFVRLELDGDAVESNGRLSAMIGLGNSASFGPIGIHAPAPDRPVRVDAVVEITHGTSVRRVTLAGTGAARADTATALKETLRTRLRESIEIRSVMVADDIVRIDLAVRSPLVTLNEPPTIRGSKGQLRSTSRSVSTGGAGGPLWRIDWTIPAGESLPDGPLRLTIDSVLVEEPGVEGFVGVVAIEPFEITVARDGQR